MRRTFTLQLHDVPTELPLLCPGCNAVAAGAASASWWTSRSIVPYCNGCATPPDEHFPCVECAIATDPTDKPGWRECPACKDRGHSYKRASIACHPHPTRSVALARRKPWGPLRSCRRCTGGQMLYDYCEPCIDVLRREAMGSWMDEHLPPQHFQCRSSVR